MTLWLILAGMAVVVAAVLLVALLRRSRAATPRAAHDIEVFRAQLRELDREVESGLVGAQEAESARLEIQRRLLAADAAQRDRKAPPLSARGKIAAAAVSLAVPAAAFAVYLYLGSPDVPSLPFAERMAAGESAGGAAAPDGVPDVETMMARLKTRLAENPQDLEGWMTLGRSAFALGRFDEAIAAFERAIALDDGIPFLHSALSEALIMAADGVVTPRAERALERALELDPNDPRARFYLALGKEQQGDVRGALDELVGLLAGAPADAPWREPIRERAAELARSLDLDPDEVLPPAGVAAAPAASMSADELAARLAEKPKDFEGWIRLARLRAAEGDEAGAREALERGREVFAGAPFVQQQFDQAAAELGLGAGGARGPSPEDMQAAAEMDESEQQEMIRGMVDQLAERLAEDPDDAEGWRMLARSYMVLGEPKKAADAFGELAARRPDDPVAQVEYARALKEARGERALMEDSYAAALRRALRAAPDNPDGLFLMGELQAWRGDPAAAREYWTRLLKILPSDSDQHQWLSRQIEALPSG